MTINEDILEIITVWGRSRSIRKDEITQISFQYAGGQIVVRNAAGKKLFKFAATMTNASQLYYALTGKKDDQA